MKSTKKKSEKKNKESDSISLAKKRSASVIPAIQSSSTTTCMIQISSLI